MVDFKRRAENIKKIKNEMEAMIEREKEMKTIIEMHQRKMRKSGFAK